MFPFSLQSVAFLKNEGFIVQIWGTQKDQQSKGPTKKKSGLNVALHTVNTNVSVSVNLGLGIQKF